MATENKAMEIAQVWDEMKTVLRQRDEQIEKHGAALEETLGKLGELHEQIEKLEDAQKDLATKHRRPEMDPAQEQADLVEKAWNTYMRSGERKLNEDMTKALERKAVATDQLTEGGVWMPANREEMVISYLREIDQMRQIANVVTISEGDYWEVILENSDDLTASWTSERGTRSETATPGVKLKRIYAHELYAMPAITQKALDDLAFDVDGWIMSRVSERFAQVGGAAFISGTGSGQPFGLEARVADSTISTVPSLDADEITADGLIALVDDQHPRYQGEFLMHRKTRRAIRQLTDSYGQYLWERSIQGGQPSQLLGFPIYESTSLPSPTAAGVFSASEEPVFFGNFKEGYTIVDRIGMQMLRDPYSSKPYILFYTTHRVGGDVVNGEALKALTISAS